MIIKVKNEYRITQEKVYTGKINIDLTSYLKEVEPEDEDALIDAVRDYIFWDSTAIRPYNKEDVEFLDEYEDEDRQIENEGEIIDTYKHLLKVVSCCDDAPYNAKFCPECGKKLKN